MGAEKQLRYSLALSRCFAFYTKKRNDYNLAKKEKNQTTREWEEGSK
jgi:hypothetical protein